MTITVVNQHRLALTETFIQAHIDRLPAETNLIHGHCPQIEGDDFAATRSPSYLMRRIAVRLGLLDESHVRTGIYRRLLRRTGADLVLAEFGTAGIRVMEACERENLPLMVYFRGHDASKHELIEQHRDSYQQLFRQAAALVAVSQPIRQRLIAWGADPQRTYYSPSGVDCSLFAPASFDNASPTFLFVGRFVEKKAPHLTLLAFAKALQTCPEIRLRMIGDGPLEGPCRDLAQGLGIGDAVTFMGSQPHAVVVKEMRRAWAYVQHSLTAKSGDSEGMPIAILEAGACGLPVISTRHAGIPDAVLHEKTGLLVEERDVDGMAEYIKLLANDRKQAQILGRAARERITTYFTMERSIDRLWRIIQYVTDSDAPPVPRIPEWVEAHEPAPVPQAAATS